MTIVWSILGFVVAMGLLVAIHEWGHYAVARFFNIKVTHFSLGFGKVLYRRQKGETQFQLAAIPLGGYVKFVDEREGPVAPEDLPRAFNRQSVYRRFAVVAAGPLVNLVFAWLAFSMIYFSGVTELKPVFKEIEKGTVLAEELPENNQAWLISAIDSQEVYSWKEVYHAVLLGLVDKRPDLIVEVQAFQGTDTRRLVLPTAGLDINEPKQNWLRTLGFEPNYPEFRPIINQVLPNSPAQDMGLKTGDLISVINGFEVQSWQELVAFIRAHPGETVGIDVMRGHQLVRLSGMLESKTLGNKTLGSLGASVQFDEQAVEPYKAVISFGVLDSMVRGWQHTWNLVDMTLTMIQRMFIGEVSVKNLSGPVSIAEFSGKALQSGWVSFLTLLGLLSLSLGVLNLLPIPVLDGGHLTFYLIEMIKGSPVSETVEIVAQKIGLVLILSLTFFALFNDVVRISNG